MVRNIILVLIGAVALCSCGESERNKRLVAQNDSLKTVLRNDRELARSLREVSALVGSIGVNGRAQRTTESSETTVDRVRAVSAYVAACRLKMDSLSQSLNRSKSINANYSVAISKFQKDIENRDNQLSMMDQIVMLSMNQNDNLIHVVGLQQSEIDDKLSRLKMLEVDNTRLQTRVNLLAPLDFSKSFVILPPLK